MPRWFTAVGASSLPELNSLRIRRMNAGGKRWLSCFFARLAASLFRVPAAMMEIGGPAPPTPRSFSHEANGFYLANQRCCDTQSAVPQHRGRNPIRIARRSGCPPAEPYPAQDARACETGRPNQGKTLQQQRNLVLNRRCLVLNRRCLVLFRRRQQNHGNDAKPRSPTIAIGFMNQRCTFNARYS